MAKDNQDIDRLFRDKLGNYSSSPSAAAWEKLEKNLSQSKKGAPVWMRIAATAILLGGMTALLWLSIETTQQDLHHAVADQEPTTDEPVTGMQEEQQESPVPLDSADEQEGVKPEVDVQDVRQKAPVIIQHAKVIQQRATLAEQRESAPVAKEEIELPEPLEIALPPLDVDLLTVDNALAEANNLQEVAYKVTIKSNGLKDKPEKEGLVGEIENKIDKIGGLIVKVDQGFADLQDAKNNLFASITTKGK